MSRTYWLARAWLGEGPVIANVQVQVDASRFTGVETGVSEPAADADRLTGLTIPGFANCHSHAFHRALRGRTQRGRGTFWTWREQMYGAAARLDPDRYYDLACATYREMAATGITAVGEFHYVHHDRTGRPYADRNAMGHALLAAAREAGLRITLIDTCYLWSGLNERPPEGVQARFSDGSGAGWAERVSALSGREDALIAAGVHSVRAVDPGAMAVVRDWAAARGAPLHLHLSEQRLENEQCLDATGRTPTQLLADAGVLGAATTAVHATHLEPSDVALLGASHTNICVCPTTERDLADGIGPARALATAGCPLCLGSDMHCFIDLFEEARAMELNERLQSGQRGIHHPHNLLDALTATGMRALGWDAGRLEIGALADFATVSLSSPRTAGARPAEAVEYVLFGASASDVTHVVVGGKPVVVDGRHLAVGDVGDVGAALAQAVARVDAVAV